MTEKVVSVRLRANVEGFTAGMAKAKKSVDDLTKADVPKAAKGYSDLANKAALAGAAVAVGLGVAVKRFAEFDATMSAVKANVGGTAAEMESLRKAAIQLGADSQFSANEAAQGINELGKAGLKSADILNGGLKGALDLAAAGQIDVAQAAETTATALSQFKLGGDKAVHVADLLAAGANKAQGGVGDLGAALGQAGLVAAGMGLSVEETTAGLTAFAKAGLIGSDAGTSFKTMIQRLQAPIGDAKQMLDKYSISAYDASGNFVGLANVAGQLQDRFKNLTPEVRNNALAVIFGSDAIRGANVLYEQGADGIANWVKEVDQTGFAAKQAADLTDNLRGDLERLGGAFDSVLIQTGSSANGSLRTIVQGFEGLVNAAGRIPGPVLAASAGLAAIALVLPKGIITFRKYQANLDSIGVSFDKIEAKSPRAAKAFTAVTGSLKALGTAASILAVAGVLDNIAGGDNTRTGTETLIKDFSTAEDVVSSFSSRMQEFAGQSSSWFSTNSIDSYDAALEGLFDQSWDDKVDQAVGQIGAIFGATDNSRAKRSAEAIADIDATLAAMVTSGNAQGAALKLKQFTDYANAAGVTTDEFVAKLPTYTTSLSGVDLATGKVKVSTAQMAESMALAVDQTDSVSAAIVALGGSAAASSEEVKGLASIIETDMKAASTAFGNDLDVLSNYDPDKAAGNVTKASKKSEAAEKRLQDVRERIAAKKKTTVADTQALENATAKAAEARAEKVAAADEATGQSLSELYKDSVKTAKRFATDIQRVTEAGLDPAVVAKLLQEGPEKAAPVLKEMLGKHGANLIKMVNDSEAALTALNQNVVQQARLTAIAVNASSDEVAGHLDEATRIVQAKAAAQGEITAEELAAKLKLPLDTVTQVAQEYGIALAAAVPPEVGTYVKVNGVEAAKVAVDSFHVAVDEVPETVGTYVTAPGVTLATTDVGLFHTAVSDLPDSKDIPVSTSGTPATVADLVGVKTQLDALKPKTVQVRVSGVAAAIAQINGLLTTLGRAPSHADFKAAQENALNAKRHATGGAIYGPGTGTSDSIPAWLSNGEHVLTAAEVAKLGGQSAAYALRAAIRQGRMPGFASGGAVVPRYAPAMSYAGPTSYRTTHDSRLVADVVNIITEDASSFKRELRTSSYRAKARPGR